MVHPNMQVRMGVVLSLGGGAIYGSSTKQKQNTRISTEAELVGVNNALLKLLWTRQFLSGQGFGDKDTVIYQDNQSVMLLEKYGGGKASDFRQEYQGGILHVPMVER